VHARTRDAAEEEEEDVVVVLEPSDVDEEAREMAYALRAKLEVIAEARRREDDFARLREAGLAVRGAAGR
jgi:hypothetical protein